jgi:hypothetical protein
MTHCSGTQVSVRFHDYKHCSFIKNKAETKIHKVTQSRPTNNQEDKRPTQLQTQRMTLNMANWKKGLLLIGLATAMFATQVMGIEVRHDGVVCDPLSNRAPGSYSHIILYLFYFAPPAKQSQQFEFQHWGFS